jgi:hypothetical protein
VGFSPLHHAVVGRFDRFVPQCTAAHSSPVQTFETILIVSTTETAIDIAPNLCLYFHFVPPIIKCFQNGHFAQRYATGDSLPVPLQNAHTILYSRLSPFKRTPVPSQGWQISALAMLADVAPDSIFSSAPHWSAIAFAMP